MTEERLESIYTFTKDINDENFMKSIEVIVKQENLTDYINPVKLIREHAGGEVKKSQKEKDDEDAIDATTRIFGAVPKYGYTRADKARQVIGELGWECVDRNGGWQLLCETLTLDNMGTLKAQYRETCKAIISRRKRGVDDVPPTLPNNNKISLPENIKRLTEKIGSKL